ncbi:LD-carboxypeptidase [Clostridium carnis]
MNSILHNGNTIGLIACSNGLDKSFSDKINILEKKLNSLGLNVVYGETLFKKHSIFSGSAKDRAEALTNLYLNKNIKAIFDLSGGDVANEVLSYLDFNVILNNPKPFFGYSDLTVLLNAIYHKTKNKTYLYQLRNLIGSSENIQMKNFENSLINNYSDLFSFDYIFIQGTSMEGTVIGGNIRCLLKLAGTEFFPDFQDKILFLESLGGDVAKMTTFLTQYKQLGIFKKIKGILLGTFSEMESNEYSPNIIEIITSIVDDPKLPIAKTNNIGHGQDSKCLIIGNYYSI